MSVLIIAICGWLAALTLFVALRVRATIHRPVPARHRIRPAQLRALAAHSARDGHSPLAAHGVGQGRASLGAHSAGQRRSLIAAGQRR